MATVFDILLNQHYNTLNNKEPYGIGFEPELDVVETTDSFIIETELPGVNKDDIQIEIKDSKLYIQGEKKRSIPETSQTSESSQNTEFKNKNYLSERSFGNFKRYLDLTRVLSTLDLSNIKTEYTDGLLTITINKKQELSNSIKITL
ncbi:hypothetical protein DICPUDRAFT_91743 [Dictyostelium purpureum]|uniref:SHSP domain-containing protein n=1 Tax=Dictyostelium purpureum TaxID=5786 RepID=F0ZGN3_DICPU|nr:uncharacterized protein DICPUDRAFT_91743 [Dictyostelium purpureum]EGC36935.1 hypothetical protein DICPUDRAFT_91743 [Dictyostelium purpureum]|eukprot:XP_003286578.1 hypothetical protein DICPUDRAFT_91743 [Dictyostelium purpureum]